MEKKIKMINLISKYLLIAAFILGILTTLGIGNTFTVILMFICALSCAMPTNYRDKLLKPKVQENYNIIPTIADLLRWYADCPQEFEKFCAELFKKMGYEAQTTAGSNDGGYDIAMRKDGIDYIAECKLYTADMVGRPLIQKLVGANATQRADKMVFITTSRFSKPAVDYATEQKVWLIDGEELQRMIDRYY